jgi:hypothetical protein
VPLRRITPEAGSIPQQAQAIRQQPLHAPPLSPTLILVGWRDPCIRSSAYTTEQGLFLLEEWHAFVFGTYDADLRLATGFGHASRRTVKHHVNGRTTTVRRSARLTLPHVCIANGSSFVKVFQCANFNKVSLQTSILLRRHARLKAIHSFTTLYPFLQFCTLFCNFVHSVCIIQASLPSLELFPTVCHSLIMLKRILSLAVLCSSAVTAR